MINLPESALVLPSMTAVNSSSIHSVAYSQYTMSPPYMAHFYVRFNSLKVYVYEMTLNEASLHFGIIIGPDISAGEYFTKNIRSNFSFKDITNLIQKSTFQWSTIFSPDHPIGIRCGLAISSKHLDII